MRPPPRAVVWREAECLVRGVPAATSLSVVLLPTLTLPPDPDVRMRTPPDRFPLGVPMPTAGEACSLIAERSGSMLPRRRGASSLPVLGPLGQASTILGEVVRVPLVGVTVPSTLAAGAPLIVEVDPSGVSPPSTDRETFETRALP